MTHTKNIALAMMATLALVSSGLQGEEVVAELVQEESLSCSHLSSEDNESSDLVSQAQGSNTAAQPKQNTSSGHTPVGCGAMPGATGATGGTGMTGMTGVTATTEPNHANQAPSGSTGGGASSYKKGTSKASAGK